MNLLDYLPPCKQPGLCYQYNMSIWSVSHNREKKPLFSKQWEL